MAQYNPNDFYPHSGQEIKSDGTTVNPADSVDSSGNQGTIINKISQLLVNTQNALTIPASGSNTGSWISSSGYDKLAYTATIDSAVSNNLWIHWSNDGANRHGNEQAYNNTNNYNQGVTDVKAPWFRFVLSNGDATNPHIMSAWAFLKA